MATNRRKGSARLRRSALAHGTNGTAAVNGDLVALYNANCDLARDYVRTTLDAADRLQAIGVERGEQAIALAGRAIATLASADATQALAAQSALAHQVLGETLRWIENVAAVSAEARGELLLILDRQYRLNGLSVGLPVGPVRGEAVVNRASPVPH